VKKLFANILLVVTCAAMLAAQTAAPQDTTTHPKSAMKTTATARNFRGWISDEKCGANVDADCAKKCEAAGMKMVFVNSDKSVIPVSNPETLKGLAGQHVSIKGKLDNGKLTVSTVKATP
jgi:hypothetical protein